jgi:hypothetical protein
MRPVPRFFLCGRVGASSRLLRGGGVAAAASGRACGGWISRGGATRPWFRAGGAAALTGSGGEVFRGCRCAVSTACVLREQERVWNLARKGSVRVDELGLRSFLGCYHLYPFGGLNYFGVNKLNTV